MIECDYVLEYAYIFHDKDIELNIDTGETKPKKSHFHVYIHFSCQPSKDTILNILGSCIYQSVRNKRALFRYFLHLDDSDKAQYDKDLIVSNFNLDNYLNFKSNDEFQDSSIIKIFDFISTDQFSGLDSLVKFSIDNHCYNILKTNYILIRDYIKENNFNNLKKSVDKQN